MKYGADLHIHSKFSRATSRDMILDTLAYWAKIKGISLLGTGDFTHPEWLFLAKEKLEPAGNGFFRLRNIIPPENEFLKSISCSTEDVFFILTTEISFIYSKKGKVRKIHILVCAPDFESVDMINGKLSGIGNLRSDGRPILGMDAKDFVKMVSHYCPRCMVIPAHIWTPWFSLFGANSGFDAIEECFEEVTPFIFALETGLSSDPPMNWRLSSLDKYTLVSNSDAHSPSKIGREANVFDTDFTYDGLVQAIKGKDSNNFLYTIEFFPEEGKYHYDGHRKCGVVLSPQETMNNNLICPRCRKKLTIGVMHRIEKLADRSQGSFPPVKIPYKNLIPLNEIIAQATEKSAECKSVWEIYFHFIREFGNEHKILTEVPITDLARCSPERVSAGVERMRKGQVNIVPGHDGTYGKISLFDGKNQDESGQGQLQLF
ncbi:MAG: DNA helicase UvrD [Candidatus Aminicenantes bacterium]|nr:DNA helicase UvrD [Candidatus Aminicenantes bacterium]